MTKEEQKSEVNYEAWARTMIVFIRSKKLERELADFAGGWRCPIGSSK